MWALVTPGSGFGGIITKDFRDRTRSTTEMYPGVFGMVSQIAGIEPFPTRAGPGRKGLIS